MWHDYFVLDVIQFAINNYIQIQRVHSFSNNPSFEPQHYLED